MAAAAIRVVFLATAAAAIDPPEPLRPIHVAVSPVTGAWNASILVGTHHKTGTVLLAKVFRLAAKLMGVPRSKGCPQLGQLTQ